MFANNGLEGLSSKSLIDKSTPPPNVRFFLVTFACTCLVYDWRSFGPINRSHSLAAHTALLLLSFRHVELRRISTSLTFVARNLVRAIMSHLHFLGIIALHAISFVWSEPRLYLSTPLICTFHVGASFPCLVCIAFVWETLTEYGDHIHPASCICLACWRRLEISTYSFFGISIPLYRVTLSGTTSDVRSTLRSVFLFFSLLYWLRLFAEYLMTRMSPRTGQHHHRASSFS